MNKEATCDLSAERGFARPTVLFGDRAKHPLFPLFL